MKSDRATQLGILVFFGIATDAEKEELCLVTMEYARMALSGAIQRGWVVRSEVEDAVMEITEKAWRNVRKYQCTRSSWSTFVACIARNTAADYGRRKRRSVPTEPLEDHYDL